MTGLVSSAEEESPVFPFDILELIINIIIHSVDKKQPIYSNATRCHRSSIISLSLVSRFFSDLCRPYLFRDVRIFADSYRPQDRILKRPQKLAGLIKENPTIAAHIRNLTYSDTFKRSEMLGTEKDSFDIFVSLPALSHLKVDGLGNTMNDRPCAIDLTRLGYQSLLHHNLSSNKLTSLHIRRIYNLSLLDIMTCPGLERLVLENCGAPCSDISALLNCQPKLKSFAVYNINIKSSPFDLLALCPKLECITLANVRNILPWDVIKLPLFALPIASFQNVESIKSMGSIDWTYICSLADSAGVKAFPSVKRLFFELKISKDISVGPKAIINHINSLEELTLEVKNNLEPNSLNLLQLFSVSVRTLRKITIDWTLEQGQDQLLVSTLCDALQAVSHDNIIQDIEIRLDTTAEASQIPSSQFDQWNRLDALLSLVDSGGEAFPRLHAVHIDLIINATIPVAGARVIDESALFGEYRGRFKASMSRVLTNTKLKVACSVYTSDSFVDHTATTRYLQGDQ